MMLSKYPAIKIRCAYCIGSKESADFRVAFKKMNVLDSDFLFHCCYLDFILNLMNKIYKQDLDSILKGGRK